LGFFLALYNTVFSFGASGYMGWQIGALCGAYLISCVDGEVISASIFSLDVDFW
jgi:hypothetical protein